MPTRCCAGLLHALTPSAAGDLDISARRPHLRGRFAVVPKSQNVLPRGGVGRDHQRVDNSDANREATGAVAGVGSARGIRVGTRGTELQGGGYY
jgi:hypothetical protein